MKDLKHLPFFKALKHLVPVVFLLASFSVKANNLSNSFSISITEIIKREYKTKTYREFNEFMEEHSLEDLMVPANRGNLRAQRMAFFLYYLVETESTFLIPLRNNKFILVSSDILSQIEILLQKTRTPEAWFVKGLLHSREGNYQEGFANFNEAKKAGHALSYLAYLKFSIIHPGATDSTANKELIYRTLRKMEQKNIKVPGFNFLMGSILFARGEISEAKEWFTKALNDPIFPNATKAYMGLIHKKNRHYSLAKQYMAEASIAGVDVVKPRLLEIHLQEGDYKAASELLQDIALRWGKYTDSASIKASFLLSYITGRGLGSAADPIQSYIWADRADKIYHLSRDANTPRAVNPQTERYMLPGNLTFHNRAQTIDVSEYSAQSFPKMDDPPFIFKLMSFRPVNEITQRQRRYMETHFHTLIETLTQQGKLQIAYSAADIMFRDLHFLPTGGRCENLGFAN